MTTAAPTLNAALPAADSENSKPAVSTKKDSASEPTKAAASEQKSAASSAAPTLSGAHKPIAAIEAAPSAPQAPINNKLLTSQAIEQVVASQKADEEDAKEAAARERLRQEMLARRHNYSMIAVGVILFLVCVFLAYDLYYGYNGRQQYERVQVQLQEAQTQALYLQKQNQDVADQINDLQQGSIAVEELARSELGLIKPNERFYRVLATDDKIRSMPIRLK